MRLRCSARRLQISFSGRSSLALRLILSLFFLAASTTSAPAQLESGRIQSKSGWVEDGGSADSGRVESSGGRTILKLGVEHSSKLEPIPDSLQAGSIFDERILDRKVSVLDWYRIPAWLAGKWQRENETTIYTYDFASGQESRPNRTFQSHQTAEFGVQKDSAGDIWHCRLTSSGHADHGSHISVALVEKQEPTEINPDSVIYKEVFIVLNVMKTTNVIMESRKIESLTRYRPAGRKAQLLDTSMSMKVYSPDGQPSNLQENLSRQTRLAAFTPLANYRGMDLKADLDKFLIESGLSHLAGK